MWGLVALVTVFWCCGMFAAYVAWLPEESEEVKRYNAQLTATIEEAEVQRRKVA